ncbi:MAG: NAD(P)-dependent oxidoreductase [Bacillus sp. (in: firmicutes)]
MVKVLITGGASSCIGPELIKILAEKQIQIVVADEPTEESNSYPASVATYYGIVLEKDALIHIMRKEQIDYVIHLKTILIGSNSIKDSFHLSERNIATTIQVLEACAAKKVKKIIFPSTVAVYGQLEEPITESAPLYPNLFAGVSKKIEEQYVKNYHSLYGLPYSILRFSTIYGPLSTYSGDKAAVLSTIKPYIKNELVVTTKKEELKTDFIYIKDAVSAIFASLEAGDNEVINIASGNATSLQEITDMMQKISGQASVPVTKQEQGMNKNDGPFSIKKAHYSLRWHPKRNLEDGIKDMISCVVSGAFSKKTL